MPCLLAVLGLFVPRLALALIWVFTNWFSAAYETQLWPILGFLFMPYTTLAYMAAMLNNAHSASGAWLVLVVVAALVDVGALGGGGRHVYVRQRR